MVFWPAIHTLLDTARRKRWWFLLLAGVAILGSTWLFLGVLEDVATRDPLVDVDVVVHAMLQKLRTPWMDIAMIAVTELGDAEVVVPLMLAALGWFLWHRLWQTCLYWLAAVAVAELVVKVLKILLHRARPGALYDGLESFAFPSGHATMGFVVYGFLAFLVARAQRPTARNRIVAGAVVLVASIAFSRLYLGVHWASDVIAGMSFGLAWVGALALAYSYRCREDVQARPLTIWLVAVMLVAGSWHIGRQHKADMQRYAPAARLGIAAVSELAEPLTLPRWQGP